MRIWSDNLQLPYTRKLEVIWGQTTSNFLVYNLQLTNTMVNLFIMSEMVFMVVRVLMVVMVIMVVIILIIMVVMVVMEAVEAV